MPGDRTSVVATPPLAAVHEAFLAILPRIETHGRVAFRAVVPNHFVACHRAEESTVLMAAKIASGEAATPLPIAPTWVPTPTRPLSKLRLRLSLLKPVPAFVATQGLM